MSKFKIGDSVKVVRKVEDDKWGPGWIPEMTKTLGKTGKVFAIRSARSDGYDGCYVEFPDGVRWSYLDMVLELVQDIPASVPGPEFFNGFL